MLRTSFIMLLLAPSLAFGQPDEDRARELFEQAQAHMDAGRHSDAITLLEESLSALPHPPTAYSLGLARLRNGNPLAAEAMFGRLLEGEFGQLPADRRAEVETRRAEARAATSTLSLGVRGATGAEVFVDGESWGTMRAGVMATRRLDSGTYRARANANGFEPLEQTVRLAAGETVEHVFEFVGRTLAPDPDPDPDDNEAESRNRAEANDEVDGGLSTGGIVAIIVASLVVVAGGVTAAVLANDDGGPATHPVFGRTEALISF